MIELYIYIYISGFADFSITKMKKITAHCSVVFSDQTMCCVFLIKEFIVMMNRLRPACGKRFEVCDNLFKQGNYRVVDIFDIIKNEEY